MAKDGLELGRIKRDRVVEEKATLTRKRAGILRLLAREIALYQIITNPDLLRAVELGVIPNTTNQKIIDDELRKEETKRTLAANAEKQKLRDERRIFSTRVPDAQLYDHRLPSFGRKTHRRRGGAHN